MRRGILIFVLTFLAVTMLAGSSFAIFVNPNFPTTFPGLCDGRGNGVVTLPLLQGWFCNQAAWYISTATNDIRTAQEQYLTLTPKLTSALERGANPIYVVTNYPNGGPVFTAAPGVDRCNEVELPTYSALWQVFFVTWRPGVIPHVIKNALPESADNPFGLPDEEKVTISNFFCRNGNIQQPPVPIVLDYSIIARGTLQGSPKFPQNPPRDGYRIPQIVTYYPCSNPKFVTLPFWFVFCHDPISQKVEVTAVIIPDVSDRDLAKLLGANVAPGLLDVPETDTQRFWVFNWLQTVPCPENRDIQIPAILPFGQLPIIEECPNAFYGCSCPTNSYPFSWKNNNFAYSPIMRYILLNRNLAEWDLTTTSLVSSQEQLGLLIDAGLLEIVPDIRTRLNAPVLFDGMALSVKR